MMHFRRRGVGYNMRGRRKEGLPALETIYVFEMEKISSRAISQHLLSKEMELRYKSCF
jgi:hypothetical protein